MIFYEIKASEQGGAWGIWDLTENFVADETVIDAKVTLVRDGSRTNE